MRPCQKLGIGKQVSDHIANVLAERAKSWISDGGGSGIQLFRAQGWIRENTNNLAFIFVNYFRKQSLMPQPPPYEILFDGKHLSDIIGNVLAEHEHRFRTAAASASIVSGRKAGY